MLSYIVISLPLSNGSNCWHERQRFISKMMNQICLLFLFVNYSLEEKRKRNKESHSQFHSRYFSNPNISMHILLTVLCTFLMVLVMRICRTNQELSSAMKQAPKWGVFLIFLSPISSGHLLLGCL